MIIYFISSFGHGKGGHFHSLRVISEAISPVLSCMIISVGPRLSRTIQDITLIPVYHFDYNGFGFFHTVRLIEKEIECHCINSSSNILHAFDEYAYLFARVIAQRKNNSLVLTKCGGPNPKIYFPRAKNMILFSQENYLFFRSKMKHENSNIKLIPNRVNEVKLNELRIINLRQRLNLFANETVILRIGRINEHYVQTIRQAINLHVDLESVGVENHLVLIGVIQNMKSQEKILKALPKRVHVISDEQFINSSSELLDIADIIIGTGRGLMEACSLGKVVLTPNRSTRLPVIVDHKNVGILLESNFSPRNNIIENDEVTVNYLRKLLSNKQELISFQKETKELFNKYFDIKPAIKEYQNFYNKLRTHDESLIDIIINYYRFVLRIIQAKLKIIK